MGQTKTKNFNCNDQRMSFDTFEKLIKEMNFLSRNVCECESYTMFRSINISENKNTFKDTTKIACIRVNSSHGTVDLCSFITFNNFLRICGTIQNHLDTMIDIKTQNIRKLCEQTTEHSNLISVSESYCSICFENNKDRVLPCCHAFCRKCIDQWFFVGKFECPICRAEVRTIEDEWIITELPILTEVMLDLRDLFECICY
uniref:CSON010276 protein n=1 Tax=Culicoides sonorensis TaxID=179676 RepID=A0A336M5E0_CULSO